MSKRKLLAAGRGGPRRRLGRPAHADARRPAPARLHRPRRSATSPSASASPSATAWSTSPCSSTACARTSTDRAPRVMAVLRPAQGRDRELPRGRRSRSSTRSTTPRTRPPARRKVPFSRVLYIERDDFREDPPQEVLPPRARPRGAAALRLLHHAAQEVVKDARGRGRRAALHLRPGHARRRRPGRPQGARRRCTGSRRRTPSPAEVRLYDHLFTKPDPDDAAKDGTGTDDLNPRLARGADAAAGSSRRSPGCRPGAASSSSAWATSASTRTRPRQLPVFNRTVTLRDTWAKIQAKGQADK